MTIEAGVLQIIAGEGSSIVITSGAYDKGFRCNIQGWVYIHIEGEPYERGYQYGYLATAEIVDMMVRWSNYGHREDFMKLFISKQSPEKYYELSKTYWNICKNRGIQLFWDQYPEEYKQEIKGIADGIRARGGMIHGNLVDYKDVFTLNVIEETRETISNPGGRGRPIKYGINMLKSLLKSVTKEASPTNQEKETINHCVAFIATGDATTDGGIVASHSLIFDKYMAQRTNMILDVEPSEGHRFVMTVFPGYVWSSQDFHENENGIILMETVIWPPLGPWDVKDTIPVGVRVRKAIQYSDSIDDVIEIMLEGNNGLYPSDWVMGDTKTGEIASLELGLYNHAITRTKNGFLWSCCNVKDAKVRWEQWSIFRFGILGRIVRNKFIPSSIDKKFEELGNKYYGNIDVDVVKEIMSTEEICSLTTDCKITSTKLIENLGLWVHLGRPDGFHWKPTPENEKVFRGVREMPGTGWLRLFATKSKNTYYSDVKQSNIAQKESKVIWSYQTENSGNGDYLLSTVSGDTIYTASSSSNIYAIDKDHGKLKWKHDIGEETVAPSTSESLVFTGADRGISAVDKETGQIKWERKIEGTSSKPVVTKDLVIAGCTNGEVYAFDIDSGETRWKYKLSDSVIISEQSGNIICINSGSTCQAFDIKKEEPLWEFTTKGIITKSSVIDDKAVYFGSWDGKLYAVDKVTGDLKWAFQTGWGIDTTPTIKKDAVFFGSTDNNLYALNKNTGELKWRFSCKSAIHSSPAVYGEYVFFGSDDGRLYALDKNTGELAWSFSPEFTINDDIYNFITTPILSDPVVEDGVVYIDVKGNLYALDAQTTESIEDQPIEQLNDNTINIALGILVALLITTLTIVSVKKRNKR